MSIKKTLSREAIAAELSDLRQARFAVADLQGIAYGLLSLAKAAELPREIVSQMTAAMELIDQTDKIAAARMVELYDIPTRKSANDQQEAEAA